MRSVDVVATPSEKDVKSDAVGKHPEKYLVGRADVPTENHVRILRLIENMKLGRNAVGFLTESMHGAGSPRAQRLETGRQLRAENKKSLPDDLWPLPTGN